MLRKILPLTALALAACAAAPTPPPLASPPPPAPTPTPVVITEQSESVADAVPEPPPPAPEAPARPQQTDSGRFRVGVVSVDSAEAAAPWVGKLEAAGYRTEVLPVTIEGRTWHRVLLPGYANLEEARAAIPFVEQEFGLSGVWVTSRRRAPGPSGGEPAAPAETAAAPAPEPPAATAPADAPAPAEAAPRN